MTHHAIVLPYLVPVYQYLTLSTLESTSNPKYYDREPVNRLLFKNMDDRLAQISKSGRYGTGQVVAIQCHVSKLRQTPDSRRNRTVELIFVQCQMCEFRQTSDCHWNGTSQCIVVQTQVYKVVSTIQFQKELYFLKYLYLSKSLVDIV